ncbi:MAG: DNA methyltransferase [Methylocella sp.]
MEFEHPAVFPVALPIFVLEAYTDPGTLCFDPFAGSGTTIIGGQRTGRRVRTIELAPIFAEVALRR